MHVIIVLYDTAVVQRASIIIRQGRRSEGTEAVFCLQAKELLHTGVRTRCHYSISGCTHS